MEVLVYEDTKELEANYAVEDNLSAVIVKKKRRVSFAQTQTIHIIPSHEDIETPPLLNSDPLPSKNNTSASEVATPRVSAEPQSATPRVSAAVHDHHEDSVDFGHFTSDMDTGHGSWVDDDSPGHHDSFNGPEDESGCFVHLRHISHLEDDDSIVNEVLNDDMTMDATTFSRNLSQYLKSGTTFDLQGAGHLGQVMKEVNGIDTRSEEDSMALTETGPPHWALINPHDVSIVADDNKSDMSLATGSDRIRPKKREFLLTEKKLLVSNAAEPSLPGFTHFSDKEKENLAPHKFEDGLTSNSPMSIVNPHYDSEASMSLSNTMDISLPQSLPRQSAVLMKIDGNSRTPPMSRRSSDTMMQDTPFSASDRNTTLPARNLKDLLLDHSEYTITRKICKEGDLANSKNLNPHSLRPNVNDTVSCFNHEHLDSQVPHLRGLQSFPNSREVVGDNWQNISTEKADQEFSEISHIERVQSTENRKKTSKGKVDVPPTLVSNLTNFQLTHAVSAVDKKTAEDASQGFKQLITGLQQDEDQGQGDAKLHFIGNDEKLIKVSRQSSLLAAKQTSSLSNKSSNTTAVAEQSGSQNCESKVELVEVNKQVKAQIMLDSSLQSFLAEPRSRKKSLMVLDDTSLQSFLAEPRSQKKSLMVLDDEARIFRAESIIRAKQISKENLVEDRRFHQPLISAKMALSEGTKSATKSKTPAGVSKAGGNSLLANLRAPRCLEDILYRLKNTSHIKVDEAEKKYMAQLPLRKLQTLSDYLEFSCNMQPQVDWLSEHIQELEVKLLNAKKRNTEVKSSNASAQFQKLPEESSYAFNSKLASTHSLVKKGWILWKLDAQKQVLSWLQESKDNLMKEVEEAKTKGQQVLHLKELYSLMPSKVEASLDLDEAVDNFAATRKTDQLLGLHQVSNQEGEKETKIFSQSKLEERHRQYQEACDQLSHLTSKWNEIRIKVQSIASIHSQKLHEKDKGSVENDLKASIRNLVLTNSLLQQQQVMELKVESRGKNSVIDLSLRGMYLQSFQFEGDNPLAQVQISKSFYSKAIEMAFPCMEAPLFFQYFSSDHCRVPMDCQHLYQIIHRSNYLCGCWVDVLKEIKFCRRNFDITCKFQITNGEPRLNVAFLQCQRGIRVSLTFDMECVQGGCYPFDKKPADVQIQTYGSPPRDIITCNDMASRIGRIQHGFGRLSRICNCVEKCALLD